MDTKHSPLDMPIRYAIHPILERHQPRLSFCVDVSHRVDPRRRSAEETAAAKTVAHSRDQPDAST